ncbi:autotransporter domain-containing protein, partial [Phreatobacter sp. AB_2022a]|uniref:autotransporter domain-containing protein n=1 Tax=Phreatobacter sp. AB_2022a TaxID=3003134 RepID=UPI002286CE27
DRFGQVHYADTQTVYGRIGARLARDFAIEDGRRITTWARVNYWHTFGGNGRATFANLSGGYPVALGAGLGGSWMQFGIGASGQITQRVSLFASADYNLTVAHGSGQSYTGRVGLQVRW